VLLSLYWSTTADENISSFMGNNHNPQSGGRQSLAANGGHCSVNTENGCDGAQPSKIRIDPEGAALSAPYSPRKRPVHLPVKEWSNRSNIVFVTICSKNRKPIFACEDVHALMVESWQLANHWLVGKYVIMPDHVHFFCAPGVVEYPSLKQWVKFWKTLVSKKWPRLEEQPVWQDNFWDTQLRRGDSYSAKWEYVRNNPVRAELVKRSEDWLFAGELNVLRWTE